MRYKSGFELLGLPFVHITMGGMEGGRWKRGVARGWIAIGDIAFGILFSAGGLAFGGVAVGGVAIGALTLAGFALGGYSLGGLAVGYLAVGGLAVAVQGALGGAAIAKTFAIGGLAVAEHANDGAAEKFFSEGAAGVARAIMDHSRWFVLLALLPILGRRRSTSASAPK